MNSTGSVSALISEFEATALSFQGKKGGKPMNLLPTPLQLYQVGKLLYETEQDGSEVHVTLLKSYQSLLEELPTSYLCDVLFHDINLAFSQATGTIDAVHSVVGLYSETPLASRSGFSIDLCKSICEAYSVLKQEKGRNGECSGLLRTLSLLLLESSLFDATDGQEETQLQKIMELIQTLTEDEHNACFGDMIEWQERTMPTQSLPVIVRTRFDETPQREYLLLMMTTSPKSTFVKQKQEQSREHNHPVPAKTLSMASEIQRRIELVRDVLPGLGEGFVETALSCFQGDVDRTVAALLEAQADPTSLPPILQMTDPKLSRRHTESTPDSYSLNDEEARRITKARLADMERTQEAEAYALAVVGNNNEYDDDYDDQYDGLDGGGELGGGDGETYDVDLDTIRTYNRAAMAAVVEESFWEENRNLNRAKQQQHKTKGKDDDEAETKAYRGPEKGKGGRIIGPDGKYLPLKKGGKKGKTKAQDQNGNAEGKGQTASSASKSGEQSKIQQRRKNKNKAKIANHHRKERAQKKAAQGM